MKRGSDDGRLHGVRVDTSSNVRDVSLEPDGPFGINPQLIRTVRAALDSAWEHWDIPASLLDEAKNFCRQVQIVASGGFDRARIELYESAASAGGCVRRGFKVLSRMIATPMRIIRWTWCGSSWSRAGCRWRRLADKPCDNPDLKITNLAEME